MDTKIDTIRAHDGMVVVTVCYETDRGYTTGDQILYEPAEAQVLIHRLAAARDMASRQYREILRDRKAKLEEDLRMVSSLLEDLEPEQ